MLKFTFLPAVFPRGCLPCLFLNSNLIKQLFIFILFFKIGNYGYSQESIEVYNRVIKDFVIRNFNPLNDDSTEITIIALDKPSHLFKDITFHRLKKVYRKLSEQAFNDFYKKNQLDSKLEEINILEFKLVVFNKDTIPGQEQLASAYPGWNRVIIELSNIGFNERKNQAMVYYGAIIGSGAAGGIYVIYKLKKGKWKQKKIIPAWFS